MWLLTLTPRFVGFDMICATLTLTRRFLDDIEHFSKNVRKHKRAHQA